MSVLWPRLPRVIAEQVFETVSDGAVLTAASHHPAQVYSAVGARALESAIDGVISSLEQLAHSCGYPNAAPASSRIVFDRRAAELLREGIDVSWGEAAGTEMWSFLALVALPHLTRWRFGTSNSERWVASDLTRHTWARLWWQAVVFEDAMELLEELNESELNQLLERRNVGTDRRLVKEFARAYLAHPRDEISQRDLIREAAKRFRRQLAFVETRALDEAHLRSYCHTVVREAAGAIAAQPEGIQTVM